METRSELKRNRYTQYTSDHLSSHYLKKRRTTMETISETHTHSIQVITCHVITQKRELQWRL